MLNDKGVSQKERPMTHYKAMSVEDWRRFTSVLRKHGACEDELCDLKLKIYDFKGPASQ